MQAHLFALDLVVSQRVEVANAQNSAYRAALTPEPVRNEVPGELARHNTADAELDDDCYQVLSPGEASSPGTRFSVH